MRKKIHASKVSVQWAKDQAQHQCFLQAPVDCRMLLSLGTLCLRIREQQFGGWSVGHDWGQLPRSCKTCLDENVGDKVCLQINMHVDRIEEI